MAASGWRSHRSVIEQLAAEAHRFDVHQAVRVIERLAPVRDSVGDHGTAEDEAVRFRASLSAAFPASDLAGATPPRPGEPRWYLDVNFMGLAGSFGPLPAPFTDTIVEQTRRGDHAARDFLDIFNHRLISLLHRTRRRHRPALTWARPDLGPLARALFAMIGLGTAGVRDRMSVPDRALLGTVGLLAQQPRSLHGLERLLGCFFGVPVRVDPLEGRWLALDDGATTRLGQRNTRLGAAHPDGAVLGARAWDQQAAVTVVLGPLDLATFRALLPDGGASPLLRGLIGFYTQDAVMVDVQLRLRADQVPGTRLDGTNRLTLTTPRTLAARPRAPAARLDGTARLLTRPAPTAPRLGWTSWLTTRPRSDDGVVTLAARS